MSCYIVDAKVITKIVTFVYRMGTGNSDAKDRIRFWAEGEESVNFHHSAQMMWTLGQAMLDMNTEAYFQRYGDDERGKVFKLDSSPAAAYPMGRRGYAAIYAALGTFLYQCCEGDVPETNPLYEALRRLQAILAAIFMEGSREYREARGF